MDLTQPMLFPPMIYAIVLVTHILSACVAIGSVAVTDYFHLVGLKRHNIEKKILVVYPLLSQIINVALCSIIATGILLIINKPLILQNPIFQIEIALVILLTINGIILQKVISPNIENLISHDIPFTNNMLLISAACGAFSVVSWFTVMILALTRSTGYSWKYVLPMYLTAVIIVFTIAQFFERKAHGPRQVTKSTRKHR